LQLERVSGKKLTHMLSIQKCPTDQTGLSYVPPSTSQNIFVKLVIPESPPSCVDKGKTVMEGEFPSIPQPLAKLPIRRKPPTCNHCGELGHIKPKCPHRQAQRKTYRQAPKTPMCHQCGVSNHVHPRGPPPQKNLPRHPEPPPRNPIPSHQQQWKPTPAKKTWVPKKPYVEKQKTPERKISCEGTPFVSSFMRDLVKYLELQLKKGGHDKEEDTHSPRGSKPT
jgi:hypothetical protein